MYFTVRTACESESKQNNPRKIIEFSNLRKFRDFSVINCNKTNFPAVFEIYFMEKLTLMAMKRENWVAVGNFSIKYFIL